MPAIRPRDGNDDILIGQCEPRMIATLKASKLSLALFYIDAKSTGRSCFSFSVWRLAVSAAGFPIFGSRRSYCLVSTLAFDAMPQRIFGIVY